MIAYDPSTALIVVDVQNDFADPDGNLYVDGGEDIIPIVNEEIERARLTDALVVYTRDWHPEDTPHFAKDGGIWPVHCVRGTWGAAFHPDLDTSGPVVSKGIRGEDGYSGFTVRDPESGDESATDLQRLLEEHEIRRVIVVGLALDYCVKATALDAAAAGFATTVLQDATRAVDLTPGDGERAEAELAAAGVSLA
jgi:nicotinamidase/pyrazinamidase